MTDYVKSTAFASKDALLTGNPLKIVKGTEIDTEFNNIQTSSATKADILNPTFTGTPAAPTAVIGTVSTQIATTAFATALSPAGSILMWATATPPSGFLLCSGTAVSRTTYSALFAIVGVIFGVGDGSTTFNLPDYRNRMPIGAGTTYVAAGVGGSADAINVSHSHTATSIVSDPGHFHWQTGNNGPFSGGTAYAGMEGTAPNTHNVTTDTKITGVSVATTTASAGASGTNANLPPYIGIFFIIKT